MNFERLGRYRYRIPREGKMQVEATFYASEKILDNLAAEDYASLRPRYARGDAYYPRVGAREFRDHWADTAAEWSHGGTTVRRKG